LVVTAAGDTRSIVWPGSRRLDCTRHRDPAAVWPVRIRAGALAPDLPARDLWVSPGHSLFLDGSLFQAVTLINGATIERVEQRRVEYWHVELDRHDLVLAEGAPAESYLNTGNRTSFVNGGEFVDAHPNFKAKHWSDTCAPLIFEGPALEQVRAALLQRALARELGVCVGRLQIDGTEIPLADDAACASGWHPLEKHAVESAHRWSKASTPLPGGSRLVVLEVAGRSYCWEPPPSNVTTLSRSLR
jgi:hypothetical protein